MLLPFGNGHSYVSLKKLCNAKPYAGHPLKFSTEAKKSSSFWRQKLLTWSCCHVTYLLGLHNNWYIYFQTVPIGPKLGVYLEFTLTT